MSNQITVPFCYLPNSKAQVFDLETSFRSKFQIEQLKAVSEREDFGHFLGINDRIVYDDEPNCHSKFWSVWYDKNGNAFGAILGLKKFLGGKSDWTKFEGQTVNVDYNHPVFVSRCE